MQAAHMIAFLKTCLTQLISYLYIKTLFNSFPAGKKKKKKGNPHWPNKCIFSTDVTAFIFFSFYSQPHFIFGSHPREYNLSKFLSPCIVSDPMLSSYLFEYDLYFLKSDFHTTVFLSLYSFYMKALNVIFLSNTFSWKNN